MLCGLLSIGECLKLVDGPCVIQKRIEATAKTACIAFEITSEVILVTVTTILGKSSSSWDVVLLPRTRAESRPAHGNYLAGSGLINTCPSHWRCLLIHRL